MSNKTLSNQTLLNETLSALLDHEAGKTDALELRRLARAMEDDPELAERYQRFSLASAVMQGDALTLSTDFLSRVQKGVHADLEGAQTGNDFNKTGRKPWLKLAGQFALAASVAVIAITYVQTHRLPEPLFVAETAVLTGEKKLGDNADSRLLNSRVLTVSAGNGFVEPRQKSDRSDNPSADCVVMEQGVPVNSGLRQIQLPEGYVLCQMDENHQRCHAVSSSLACTPR